MLFILKFTSVFSNSAESVSAKASSGKRPKDDGLDGLRSSLIMLRLLSRADMSFNFGSPLSKDGALV